MSFNCGKHEPTGRFCPYCLLPLIRVIETGFEFCIASATCEYEVDESQTVEPLDAKAVLQERIKRLNVRLDANKEDFYWLNNAIAEAHDMLAKLENGGKESNDG